MAAWPPRPRHGGVSAYEPDRGSRQIANEQPRRLKRCLRARADGAPTDRLWASQTMSPRPSRFLLRTSLDVIASISALTHVGYRCRILP